LKSVTKQLQEGVYVDVFGPVVQLRFDGFPLPVDVASKQYLEVYTLPVEYRPRAQQAFNDGGSPRNLYYVGSNGIVGFANQADITMSAGSKIYFSICYIV
jgi:hypothetical protein